jgi:hypothetical protein
MSLLSPRGSAAGGASDRLSKTGLVDHFLLKFAQGRNFGQTLEL